MKEETTKRDDYLTWDETFMQMAHLIAQRSKDPVTQAGAVIVNKNNIIVGLGYNGFPRGCSDDYLPWCREGNYFDTKYAYVVHAEANAVFNANQPTNGCKLYCTLFPCNECAKIVIQNGITEIIYAEDKYHDDERWQASRRMLYMAGVKYHQYHPRNNLSLQKPVDNSKIVAIVGMCGSGKSEVADEFIKSGFFYLRFGQITLDELKNRGLEVSEENEKPIREEFRQKYGMGAFATLNIPKIDQALKKQPVIADGLYSWSEYKILKDKYQDKFKVISVIAPPEKRYERLGNRQENHQDDPNMKYRSHSREDAISRDHSEIENIEKGGPIAMGDYYILNDGSLDDLRNKARGVVSKILDR